MMVRSRTPKDTFFHAIFVPTLISHVKTRVFTHISRPQCVVRTIHDLVSGKTLFTSKDMIVPGLRWAYWWQQTQNSNNRATHQLTQQLPLVQNIMSIDQASPSQDDLEDDTPMPYNYLLARPLPQEPPQSRERAFANVLSLIDDGLAFMRNQQRIAQQRESALSRSSDQP